MIRRLHAPLLAPEDVIRHLGAPHHWKEGRSAKSLIDQWWVANNLPASVRAILDQAEEWRDAELIDAFVERSTDLADGRPSHSQSDLIAVLGIGDRLGLLSIEAKVDEGFDKTVNEWLRGAGAGKQARLEKLCALFDLRSDAVGHLRYQLFHRTASAIIEAKRYRAPQAAMIVQSWCPNSSGFQDFTAFAEAVGFGLVSPNEISRSASFDAIDLRLGWSTEGGMR